MQTRMTIFLKCCSSYLLLSYSSVKICVRIVVPDSFWLVLFLWCDTLFHRALLDRRQQKINYNVHCFRSTYARFLLKNEAQKLLIRYEIHKVVYFYSGYWRPPLFFSCFLAWTFISRVYSGMTRHNTSRQQKITVRILVTGSGGDALRIVIGSSAIPCILGS